jgi:hypothetical protein
VSLLLSGSRSFNKFRLGLKKSALSRDLLPESNLASRHFSNVSFVFVARRVLTRVLKNGSFQVVLSEKLPQHSIAPRWGQVELRFGVTGGIDEL